MITEHQKNYILGLYEDLGQAVDEDVDTYTKEEGHKVIQELLALRNEVS